MNESRRDQLRSAAIVVGCAILAYVWALAGTLVYDDIHAVRDNPAIRSLARIPSFFWDSSAFSGLSVQMYRPVVITTLAIDHWIGGGAAFAFKLGNVLAHALTACLLMRCLRAFGITLRAAMWVAVLFAVHPLASEAVNIVSSRSDVLLTAGLLLGVERYLVVMRTGSRGAALGVLVGGLIACGSKETGVVLPALCLLAEFVARKGGRDEWRAVIRRLAPVVLLVVGYLIVRKLSLGIVGAGSVPKLAHGHDVMSGAGRDLLTQLCLMGHVLPRFLLQSLVPFGLTVDPWVPLHDDWWRPSVIAGWTLLGFTTWLAVRAPRARPVVCFGALFAWAVALPWVIVPLNLPACEHRFYPTLAGLCLCAAPLLAAQIERLTATPRRAGRYAALAGVVLAVGLCAARSLDYRSAAQIWRGAIDGNPTSVRALCGLAVEYREAAELARLAGDVPSFERSTRAACDLLVRALSVYPIHFAARHNLAEFELALLQRGSPHRAVVLARELHAARPENPFYRLLLSRALAAVGERSRADARFDAAVEMALSCLEIVDAKGLVFRTAALARAKQGRLDLAIELLDESVRLGLDHESVLLERAEYAIDAGRRDAAARDLRVVMQRAPFDLTARRLWEKLQSPAVAPR